VVVDGCADGDGDPKFSVEIDTAAQRMIRNNLIIVLTLGVVGDAWYHKRLARIIPAIIGSSLKLRTVKI
jgi:hypothetical protein